MVDAAEPLAREDAFAFRTTVPLHPRVDPTVMKAALGSALVVLGVALFASWVVRSERASFSRADRAAATSETLPGPVVPPIDLRATDAAAEEATELALEAAMVAYRRHGSFLDAGTARLSDLQPGYTFVDGPSSASGIVSVASTRDSWAGAVRGAGGVCLWIRTTASGDVTHGIGSSCTGAAALSVSSPR